MIDILFPVCARLASLEAMALAKAVGMVNQQGAAEMCEEWRRASPDKASAAYISMIDCLTE